MVFSNTDDEDLQERFFEILVWSNDNLIGSVYIDLSPLLQTRKREDKLPESWHPIFSVENGLRGDLKVQVNVRF